MTRRQKRKIIALAALLTLLALLAVWYVNFRATRSLKIDIAVTDTESAEPPQYMFSFGGEGKQHLLRPVGVLADGEDIYVADSRQGVVFRFDAEGKVRNIFGKGKLTTPLYVAKHPKTGEIYVTDRRLRKVQVFKRTGEFVKTFDPVIPKEWMPKFDTKGDKWVPVAIAFANDGTMYVTELLHGHRLLIFGPDGTFKRSVGKFGEANKATEKPGEFQFPNSIKVLGDEVWVTDSNNRRVQVFDRKGDFKRIVDVGGLPRGMDFLPPRSADSTGSKDRVVVIDTLAHDATIFSKEGQKVVGFGTRGVLEGQFNYPTDVSVGERRRIYVSDTSNVRIQVWGWPADASPVPPIRVPQYWGWCLSPLLLLPLLALRRKRKYVATRDFIEAVYQAEQLHLLPHGRRQWLVTQIDYDAVRDLTEGDIRLGDVLTVGEHSDSDVRALAEKYEVPTEQAVVLSLAQRAKILFTESAELRRVAKVLEIDVANADEFAERFRDKKGA